MKKITISNVKALQFFQLFRYGAFLIIGILLSKSGFGKTNIGYYESFLLIAGAFTFFWVNGFLKVIMPLSSEKAEAPKKELLFNAFLLLLFFSFVSAILILLLQQPVSTFLLNGNIIPMPHILALYILFNSSALMTEYIYMINNRSSSIMIYGTVIFSLQIAAIGIPAFLGYSLNTILIALLIIAIIKFCWLCLVLSQYSKLNFQWPLIKEFIVYGAPLVLSTLLSSSAVYIDGFIITSQFTPDDFAIFKYGARELPLALLMANSLSMAMLTRFSKKEIESPLAEFRSEVYRLHWWLFPISLILMLTSHWFYPLVFTPEFEQSATIFNIYLLLVISRLLFPQTLLIAKKINSIIVKASLFEIIINVALSLVLAKYMGIKGVAYATFVAYLFEKIYLMIACKRKLNISPIKYLPLSIYFITSSLLIAAFIFVEFILY